MRKLTYVFFGIGVLGVFWAILAGVRWMWIYPDTSQAIMGVLIGVGITIMAVGFAYTYEKLDYIQKKIRYDSERFDSLLVEWNGQKELNSLRKKN